MLSAFRSRFRAFRRDEKGSLSVEAVLIFPILMWAYAAMFVYWDAFKTQNINLKATYTVADLISRYDCPVWDADIEGMNQVYRYLIRSTLGNDLRVTVVSMGLEADGVTPKMDLEWSYGTGDLQEYTDLNNIQNNLPFMATGDELIVVETVMNWEPPITYSLMSLGLGPMEFTNFVFTSPRFVGQVKHNEACS